MSRRACLFFVQLALTLIDRQANPPGEIWTSSSRLQGRGTEATVSLPHQLQPVTSSHPCTRNHRRCRLSKPQIVLVAGELWSGAALSGRLGVDHSFYLIAGILGVIEGLTEFLPVSSTGHLILAVDLLGFRGPAGHVFEIAIQLGAILAVVWLYWHRFTHVAASLLNEPAARRFVLNVLLGFLPSMVIGALAYGYIKTVLFSPEVVAVTLVLGGFAILAIERWNPRATVQEVDSITPQQAVKIGVAQCVSMIPGVSRAGATIMGAMMFGIGRAAATEFSFFLAVPTMLAATMYDVYKNWSALGLSDFPVLALGFVAAFFSALVVVKTLVGFVSRNGFAPFAYYRIGIGFIMLAVLALR
jgi:undecaprenyl-diphosphatase